MALNVEIQPPPDYWTTEENFRQESELLIPVKNAKGHVVQVDLVDPTKLPENDEILQILGDEQPEFKLWNILALHYHIRSKPETFKLILETARDEIVKILRELRDDPGRHKDKDPADMAFCLDLLANYHTLKLVETKTTKERKELSAIVMNLLSQGDKLFVYSQYHLVGRAYFCLLDQGQETEQAIKQFDFVLTSAPTDALALQGRGIAAFLIGDYKKGLSCFKKVLQHHPGCSADIRVGIGHCLFKLGFLERARLAYNRAIQLDPSCSEARIGLGLILWNEGVSASLEEALRHIVHVHKKDVEAKRVNPVNLNILADHYFFSRKPDVALKLSTAAIQSSFNETLKAESAYSVGRSYHYLEDYDQAFQYYYQATQFAKPNYVLPWFGLGQMYIERIDRREHPNAIQNAIQCFEKVLAASPNNIETLRILGLLYLSADMKDKKALARTYLKKVSEMCASDVDAHIKFAELQESIDPKSALDTYLRVIQIFEEQSDRNETPPEILNNISVLYFNLGQFQLSRRFLNLAQARAEQEYANARAGQENQKVEIHYKSILTTMMYNQGRLHEELRETEEAENCYKKIATVDQPKYIDCYLRYGCIARDKGNILKASDWFKEAAHANGDHPDSHLLLGNLHMAKGEYGPAQKKYEKVLDNPTTKTDTYALLSLGNIWLETLYQSIPDLEKKKRHAERAFMLYKQVLKLDPTNVYAVNGMGAVLARTGQLEEAKEMFSVVRESTADILDLWLNIGHSYCDQRQYVAGIKMYENALKRFKDASLDPTIFLYLARAQYFHGDLRDARKTLQLARRLAPQNQALRYNLAVIMKRMALLTFGDARNITNPTLAEVEGAVVDLSVARNIFAFLSTEGDKSVVDLSRAQREMRKCEDLILISTAKKDDAERNDRDARQKREINEKNREQYEILLRKEADELEEQKRQETEDKLKRRQEVIARTMEVKEKIIRHEAGEDIKPARKRTIKAAGIEDDGFIDDQGNRVSGKAAKRARGEGGAERKNRKAARRKRHEERREQGLTVSSEEENDEPEAASSSRKRTNEPEYDRKGRRIKSAAFISDSGSSTSSDSDDAGGEEGKKRSSGSDGDEGERDAKKALASSDEEDAAGSSRAAKKPRKAVMASSDDDDEDAAEKPRKPAKKALADSDEDGDAGAGGDEAAVKKSAKSKSSDEDEEMKDAVQRSDDAGGSDGARHDRQPKKAKLSLNDSDSD